MSVDIEKLRKACGGFLKTNGIRAKTVTGRRMIHAFYFGALTQADETQHAYISICLLCGRHEELIA